MGDQRAWAWGMLFNSIATLVIGYYDNACEGTSHNQRAEWLYIGWKYHDMDTKRNIEEYSEAIGKIPSSVKMPSKTPAVVSERDTK